MKDIEVAGLEENDKQVVREFEEIVKNLPLEDRVQAALLLELFEESV